MIPKTQLLNASIAVLKSKDSWYHRTIKNGSNRKIDGQKTAENTKDCANGEKTSVIMLMGKNKGYPLLFHHFKTLTWLVIQPRKHKPTI